MSKVTSKLQVTIPKAIADRYGIRPGDEIEWTAAGDSIRVVPRGRRARAAGPGWRLTLFDAATERQRLREPGKPQQHTSADRGWSREDLYDRGRPR